MDIYANDTVLKQVVHCGIDETISEYDDKIFRYLKKRDYEGCDQALSDFCFELLELSETKQLFIARNFYLSVVTNIVRIQNHNGRAHPQKFMYAYKLMSKIEEWTTLSEFILHSTLFVDIVKNNILSDEGLSYENPYINRALYLIDIHLNDGYLTVHWLANEIDISANHLTNLFKLRIGNTVSTYITKRKLKEIIFELTYTSKSLKKIREDYGYFNHSHFIEQFKKYYGKTPLQYKQDLID